MGGERVVLEKGDGLEQVVNCIPLMQEIAKGLNVNPNDIRLGMISEGFGSIGVTLLAQKGEGDELTPLGVFLRMPFLNNNGKSSEIVAREMVNAGYPLVRRMLAVVRRIDGEDQVAEIPLMERERVCLCGLPDCNCYPLEANILVQVLEQLTEGEPFAHLVWREELDDNQIIEAYRKAGMELREIHESEAVLGNSQWDAWRMEAVYHVVNQSERMGKIVNDLADGAPWFDVQTGVALIEKMKEVSKAQVDKGVGMVRAHGDYWIGNWWYAKDGQLIPFDPALAFAPRGYDVGFGIGNELIRYLAGIEMGDKLEIQKGQGRIESFMEGYGSDMELVEALTEVWNPLVFKMLVGAAYDRYSEEMAEKLVVFAGKLVDYKINCPDAVFSLALAKEIWLGMARQS